VGGEADVLHACAALAGDGALEVVDLGGATVVPGLVDSHAHLAMESARRMHADLSFAVDSADAARTMAQWAANMTIARWANETGGASDESNASAWLLGNSWDNTQWPDGEFPTAKDLDAASEATLKEPCFLYHISGHAAWVNTAALQLAGITDETPDPPGGRILRDAGGAATGILTDFAIALVEALVPLPSLAAVEASLASVFASCLAEGLTGVHDLDALPADLELFAAKETAGGLPMRIYAFRDGAAHFEIPPPFSGDMLSARGVKFFADGAMGSWSAAMLEPYSDHANETGTMVYSLQDLRGNISRWANAGYQVATHAIGDAANRLVLDAYESFDRGPDSRWRIEHAQILDASDVPRFANLSVIASFQPSHCASDLGYAVDRLGPDRAALAYAWQSLLATKPLAMPFGSDFPTAGSVPPLLGFHAAVTRQTPQGVPAGGFFPGERVSRTQALSGFTRDAAFASFREDDLGRIKEGFRADLTVFDIDILSVDANEILSAQIVATVVGGNVAYAPEGSPLRGHFLAQARPSRPLDLDEDAVLRIQRAQRRW